MQRTLTGPSNLLTDVTEIDSVAQTEQARITE
jgi:hypothetical protein